MCTPETYTYDAWGNLLTLGPNTTTQPNYVGCTQESGFNYTGAIATNNRLAVSGFSYDSAGNTTASPGFTYVYDAENHLITTAGVTYAYDGDGRRVSKSTSKLYWYGSGGEILSETDAAGNTTAEYLFFGGKRIAMVTTDDLTNNGFEQGSTGWTLCSGAQVVVNSGNAHTGSEYLQSSAGAGASCQSQYSQFFAVTPGMQIDYGGWAYLQSGSGGYVRWNIGIYDSNHNFIRADAPNPNTVTSATWTYQTTSYTVAAGVAYVQIYAEIYQPTTATVARFDDSFLNLDGATVTSPLFYVEDSLGSSRIVATGSGAVCYDADFTPFGGERAYTNTCPQNYKFEGKERDTETGNDDFGARYYTNRFGRWLSADWSAVPVAVPYATLANPQTLNLYSIVGDDPETSVDLDGHIDGWDVVNFIVGAFNAAASDTVGGAGRQSQDTTAGKLGAAAGDLAATVFGGTETVGGVAGVGTGVALTSTGEGALVGVPLVVVSATATVQGAVTATTGAANLGAAAGDAINGAMQSKGTGSYTNTHESGMTYDGKGGTDRAAKSGARVEKETGDKHVSTDHTPSSSDREGFKDESRRLDSHGGPSSNTNHNKIESPGKNYRKQDGSN